MLDNMEKYVYVVMGVSEVRHKISDGTCCVQKQDPVVDVYGNHISMS